MIYGYIAEYKLFKIITKLLSRRSIYLKSHLSLFPTGILNAAGLAGLIEPMKLIVLAWIQTHRLRLLLDHTFRHTASKTNFRVCHARLAIPGHTV